MLSRRTLIIGGLAGGALAVGYSFVPGKPEWNGPVSEDETLLNNWVKVDKDGTITVFSAQAEMGQGIHSALASVLAEEMGADWSKVEIKQAPNHPAYSNLGLASQVIPFERILPEFLKPVGTWATKEIVDRVGMIFTAGSSSMRDKYTRLREAGALARMAMIEAAAAQWDVDADECVARNSYVVHPASDKRLDFGALAEAAGAITVTKPIQLKSDVNFGLVGKAPKRLDIPPKVNGTAVFGGDIRLDGMVYAAMATGGASLGRVIGVKKDDALAQSGIIDVIVEETWVAVIGETHWQAKTALEYIEIEWDRGRGAVMIDDWQEKRIRATSLKDEVEHVVHADDGVDLAFADAADVFEATYQTPYLAHACMETNTATAHWTPDGTQVWAPTQSATLAVWAVAGALDEPKDSVTVHTTLLGGGFGRKAEPDTSIQAALLSKKLKRPVQVIWSREEDMRGDSYRPAAAGTLRAAIGADGSIRAVKAHLSSQSVMSSFGTRWMGGDGTYGGGDPATVEGLDHLPYDFGAYNLGYTDNPAPARVGYWRSVGHSSHAYFLEAFVDELAFRTQVDPLEFRRKNMIDKRGLAVLNKAAELSGYEGEIPRGRVQGIAYHQSFGSRVATVAELAPIFGGTGSFEVVRVFSAIDCGRAINPKNVEAQVEGSIVFALSAIYYGEIRFDGGVPDVGNFDTQPLLSFEKTPDIQVHVMESTAPPEGVGEPGLPPVAPAVTNAALRLSGKAIRRLPLAKGLPESVDLRAQMAEGR